MTDTTYARCYREFCCNIATECVETDPTGWHGSWGYCHQHHDRGCYTHRSDRPGR